MGARTERRHLLQIVARDPEFLERDHRRDAPHAHEVVVVEREDLYRGEGLEVGVGKHHQLVGGAVELLKLVEL